MELLRRTLVAVLVFTFTGIFAFSGCSSTPPPGGVVPGAKSRPLPPGPDLPVSPETAAFLAKTQDARKGTAVDFDGDGTAEFVATSTPSGLTIRVDDNGDGQPEHLVEWDQASGQTKRTVTAQTGEPVLNEVYTHATRTSVTLSDADLDGKLEQRVTVTVNDATDTERVLVERDSDGQGHWVKVSESTGSPHRNGDDFYVCNPNAGGRSPHENNPLAGCDGWVDSAAGSNYPDGMPNSPVPNSRFGVYDNGTDQDQPDGSCSHKHADALGKALKCAMDRMTSCVGPMNESLRRDYDVFSTFGSYGLACGNRCPNTGATTNSGAKCMFVAMSGGGTGIGSEGPIAKCLPKGSNFKPSSIDNSSPTDLCMAVLHELLHASGASDAGSDTHDICKNDAVYSCARYCAGCTNTTAPQGVGSAADCAVCADTKEKKRACGVKKKLKPTEINVATCHNGFASGDCEEPKGVEVRACDGTLLDPVGDFFCCAKCPEGSSPERTDLPCSSEAKLDECTKKPDSCPPPPTP